MFPFSRYRIVGHSMEPTLMEGEKVWVNNWAFLFRDPVQNEIVVFSQNQKVFIKRVREVSPQGFFVAGDNEKDSLDSRSFGLVEKKEVLGKVLERKFLLFNKIKNNPKST